MPRYSKGLTGTLRGLYICKHCGLRILPTATIEVVINRRAHQDTAGWIVRGQPGLGYHALRAATPGQGYPEHTCRDQEAR